VLAKFIEEFDDCTEERPQLTEVVPKEAPKEGPKEVPAASTIVRTGPGGTRKVSMWDPAGTLQSTPTPRVVLGV
jgi:hypothetical protein